MTCPLKFFLTERFFYGTNLEIQVLLYECNNFFKVIQKNQTIEERGEREKLHFSELLCNFCETKKIVMRHKYMYSIVKLYHKTLTYLQRSHVLLHYTVLGLGFGQIQV